MSEPNAFNLSRHFTNLINRKVSFVPARPGMEGKAKQGYGIYTVHPKKTPLIVKADLVLLGSLAGALVGLPDAEVKSRINSNTVDDLLSDSMHEVLNVASAMLPTEGRAVFKSLVTSTVYFSPEEERTLTAPLHRNPFSVEIEGYQGGFFSVLE